MPNFCAVGMALRQLDYMPVGIRLDSGDLAYQSVVVRDMFKKIATAYVAMDYDHFSHFFLLCRKDTSDVIVRKLNCQS